MTIVLLLLYKEVVALPRSRVERTRQFLLHLPEAIRTLLPPTRALQVHSAGTHRPAGWWCVYAPLTADDRDYDLGWGTLRDGGVDVVLSPTAVVSG